MSVLISSLVGDVHAHAVAWGLQNYNKDVDFLAASDFPQRSFGTFDTDLQSFAVRGPEIEAPDYSVVWNRRLGAAVPGEGLHDDDQEMARFTCRNFIKSYFDCMDRVNFVNPPDETDRIERKVVQLKIAKAAGFDVPETIVSNDYERIRNFVGQAFPCIVKPILPLSWSRGAEFIALSTTRIELDDLWDRISVVSCPMIYQREIPKLSEYRVVVFGDEIVCVEILSQMVEGAELDWRVVQSRNLKLQLIACPEEIASCVRRFMAVAGLVHGSFDLIRGADGKSYFLEVNAQGQFLWLEQGLPEVGLLDRMVQFLASDGDPSFTYQRSTLPVSFVDYIKTGRLEIDMVAAMERHVPHEDNLTIKESVT